MFEPIPAGPLAVDLSRSRQLGDSTWLVVARVKLAGSEGETLFSADCRTQTVAIVDGAAGEAAAGRRALPLRAAPQPFANFGGGVWAPVCERLSAR